MSQNIYLLKTYYAIVLQSGCSFPCSTKKYVGYDTKTCPVVSTNQHSFLGWDKYVHR